MRNSSKWCVKISLANEMVVFGQKQIKFLLDENNLTVPKSKRVQRSILSFSKVKVYNVPFCHLVSEAMAAVMLQVIPSFFQKLSETSLFISTDDYNKFLVCRHCCVAAHDPAFCCLKNCKFHLLLIADKDLNDLLVKLDRVCFTYQHVECFYNLFKFRFSGNVLEKNGKIYDCVERAVSFNKLNKGVDRMPSLAKKRLLRKMFKKHKLTSVQRSISVQTTGSVFVERVESVRRKTKFELELMKIIDCFLDGCGGYESNLESFKIKPSNYFFSKMERITVYQELQFD